MGQFKGCISRLMESNLYLWIEFFARIYSENLLVIFVMSLANQISCNNSKLNSEILKIKFLLIFKKFIWCWWNFYAFNFPSNPYSTNCLQSCVIPQEKLTFLSYSFLRYGAESTRPAPHFKENVNIRKLSEIE